ncbi:MAG: chemotaxis protein CheW [Gammaproteobacteria bacterium]
MSAALQSAPDPLSRWVTFQLGPETYGINVLQVQEVLRMPEIAPVPGAPYHVLGIINLRGTVVTVVDAHRLLGLAETGKDEAARIIITDANGATIGVLVDSVAEVVNLHASQIESPPSVGIEASSHYVHGVHHRDEKLLILVDLNRLLGGENG